MSSVFRFKEFAVDQTGCAMKVNTDGVLAGALAEGQDPQSILDIGTGTGVIALMLAQRFPNAKIDAVEIDEQAARAAKVNFLNSPFAGQLSCYPSSFENFLGRCPAKQYDLIVSNPPFFIDSLKNPDHRKSLARHTGEDFFNRLIIISGRHLSEKGLLWLMLPVPLAESVIKLAEKNKLYLNRLITIYSFNTVPAHRYLFSLSKEQFRVRLSDFIIYEAEKQYSEQYRKALKPFFIIF